MDGYHSSQGFAKDKVEATSKGERGSLEILNGVSIAPLELRRSASLSRQAQPYEEKHFGVDGRDLEAGESGWADLPELTTFTQASRGRGSNGGKRRSNCLGWILRGQNSACQARGGCSGRSHTTPPACCTGSGSGSSNSDIPSKESVSLGVNLIDIIRGRSCRPISLLDLRAFLVLQRDEQKRISSYMPASIMVHSDVLPDLVVLGSTEDTAHGSVASDSRVQGSRAKDSKSGLRLNGSSLGSKDGCHERTLVDGPILDKDSPAKASPPKTHDEVDALDFLVAFEKYKIKFRNLAKLEKVRSPDPYVCVEAMYAHAHRQAVVNVDLEDVAEEPNVEAVDRSHVIVEENRFEVPFRLATPVEVGLRPSLQPLRKELNAMVEKFLGPISAACRTGSGRTGAEREEKTEPSEASPSTTIRFKPRLDWMLEVGLLSDHTVSQAILEAEVTTHPDVLAPVAESVHNYLTAHVLPPFFHHVTRNLGERTSKGRLSVAAASFFIALVFSILLIIRPSPLLSGRGNVSRWWRLLTAPFWCGAIGYALAYRTGICVWLSLRGNRESDEDEECEREQIRSRISDDAGFSFQEIEDEVAAEAAASKFSNRWLAPEAASLLAFMTGTWRKKSASPKQSPLRRGENLGTDPAQTGSPSEFGSNSGEHSPPLALAMPPSCTSTRNLANEGNIAASSAARNADAPGPQSGPSPVASHHQLLSASCSGLRPSTPSIPPSIPRSQFNEKIRPPSMKEHKIPLIPLSLGIMKNPSELHIGPVGREAPNAGPKQRFSTREKYQPWIPPSSRSSHKNGGAPLAEVRERGAPLSTGRGAWRSIRQWTGFAVGTQKVLDERVRRAQQRKAIQALFTCFSATLLVMIIVVAIP
ncbi:hypothetical protein IE53DRAFT_271546 [Violaceomyces palustris]|uniref:Uncharacterized protein n=1 Tax=Violaceomyces palustris TaxID=1673888 RepID=A0ACD0NMQ0_9BASI|nr:hypothetical protein IE53DRAFT_271546 [Violaceomyces palustris]